MNDFIKQKKFLITSSAIGILIFGAVLFANFAARETDAQKTTKTEPLTALDKLEIMELAARFETALDAEDEKSFLATFTEDGKLVLLGTEYTGRKG